MLSVVESCAITGIEVCGVTIEVRLRPINAGTQGGTANTPGGVASQGNSLQPRMVLVGLPDAAIRESKERVLSSLLENGCYLGQNYLTVSLAPADLRKSGSLYDLPIALGAIISLGFLPEGILSDALVVGELGLGGDVRQIRGALPIAMFARQQGKRRLILPADNCREAAAVEGLEVIGVHSLRETLAYLSQPSLIPPAISPAPLTEEELYRGIPDYADVKGQEGAKRALMVAAAGNHNLLMVGPPGTGKSMLAKRLPSILPPLSMEESIEVTRIHSIAGTLPPESGLLRRRPFRDPHHTVSDAGLVGGMHIPRPGELSLAHCGVLFLDEFPEFRRSALEVLRQPLENGCVTLSRAAGSFVFPARVMLIAAMNPCPCGYYGSQHRQCKCNPHQIATYRGRLSGPLMDRIDLHIEVAPLTEEQLTSKRNGESSASMREKVLRARQIQTERYRGTGIRDNAGLSGQLMDQICPLSSQCVSALKYIIQALQLSPRAYDRILRVARTLADLEGGGDITVNHLNEAANYRLLDRNNW